MKRARMIQMVVGSLTAVVLVGVAAPTLGSISPPFLSATLGPEECVDETKIVEVPEIPPKVDVVFAFDLTGSMGGIIATAKTSAAGMIATLNTIPDVDIQYGVMSYMDYPHSYSSCDYSDSYGGGPDYAYSLDQSVTDDADDVVAAINALIIGWGNDGPQDYTRIFYESYADSSVGWRTGAKRILVNFGDNVPHDCDLNEGMGGGVWSTGGDPGRDEVMGTADDLDLQTVLADMAASGVVLLECHTTTYASAHWDYWTGITGGGVFITASGTLVEDVVGAIMAALTAPEVCGLHLEAGWPYFSWLTSVPLSYDCFTAPATKTFDVTICVPPDAASGTHLFTISAVDNVGVSYGEQIVSIEVIVEVSVDIKPQSCPNPLNLTDKGVLSVAILGTEDFDVTQIDPASILLGREGVQETVSPLRWAYEDVATPFEGELCDCHTLGPDGHADLTLKFSAPEVVEMLNLDEVPERDTVPLILTGSLQSGMAIRGKDCVRVQ